MGISLYGRPGLKRMTFIRRIVGVSRWKKCICIQVLCNSRGFFLKKKKKKFKGKCFSCSTPKKNIYIHIPMFKKKRFLEEKHKNMQYQTWETQKHAIPNNPMCAQLNWSRDQISITDKLVLHHISLDKTNINPCKMAQDQLNHKKIPLWFDIACVGGIIIILWIKPLKFKGLLAVVLL